MNKTSFRNAHKLIPAILLGAACAVQAVESVTVKTEDTGAALVNPGMGWTMHFYSNVSPSVEAYHASFMSIHAFPRVYLSVGRRDGTPEIALPLTDDDGQRRYKLGQIDLTAKDTP